MSVDPRRLGESWRQHAAGCGAHTRCRAVLDTDRRHARRCLRAAARIVQAVVSAKVAMRAGFSAPARARVHLTPRSPTGPPRMRSITTTCVSCRSRIRVRRSSGGDRLRGGVRGVQRRALDGYIAGFELEGRLGSVMNRALRARMALHLDARTIGAAAPPAASSASTPKRQVTPRDRRVGSMRSEGKL